MIKGILHFTIWFLFTGIGYFLNKAFLTNNNLFIAWNWSYVFFPILFSIAIMLSNKYSIALIRLFAIVFFLILIVSVLSGDDFSQMGLDAIEYGSNILFPHNELLLQLLLSKLMNYIALKWALFISCFTVIICAIALLYAIYKISNKLNELFILRYS